MHQSLYLVVGTGITGKSIARYLQRRNQPFVVFDTRTDAPGVEGFQAEFPHTEVFLGELPSSLFSQLAAIILSPGVALDEPFVQQALQQNIPVMGDIECLAQEIQTPIVAITGTNGKSTVTTLVGEMAKAAGLSVAVAGNIGQPVLDLMADGTSYDVWVLELSSFQLELTQSLAATAATILNITPDHLDRHHSFAAYRQAKQRIYSNAKLVVYNRADPHTIPEDNSEGPVQVSYGLDTPSQGNWGIVSEGHQHYLAQGDTLLLPVNALRIKGQHNWENALAACALASAVSIPTQYQVQTLQTFGGLPHRCQWVRTLNEVDWINDSKGTNVGATLSAINGIGKSLAGKVVLLAGGEGKGADFSDLRNPITHYVRCVILLGQDAPIIADHLANTVPIMHVTSLEQAVNTAKDVAQPGDVVLLSPACASFDMFRDFNHRGESFTIAVNCL